MRSSPPYSARDFRPGTSKRGNDGIMYVVSSRSVNGVKRWLKKKPRPLTPKAQRRLEKGPSPGDGWGFVYALKHPTKKWYTFGATKHRPGTARPRRTPVSKSKATKPRGERGTITRKSSFDKVSVTFKPYYTKPRGDTGWIFWVINSKDFRTPHHGIGSGLLSGERAKHLVADGFKVYVVKELPSRWE